MNQQELLAYALVAAAVVAVVWTLRGQVGGGVFKSDRAGGWDRLPGVFKLTWALSLVFESSLGTALIALMPRRAARIAETIPPAALPLTPAHVLCSSFFMGMLCALFGAAGAWGVSTAFPTWPRWVPVGVFAFLFWMGWCWPTMNLKGYALRRQEELTRQLPFALDLITAAMRSGLEFGAALRYYVDGEVGGALQEEFSRVLSDNVLGSSFSKALKDMDERVKIEAFSSFVGAVTYGAEVGAPMASTLKTQSHDLRRARFALAERKAHRAPILLILPLAFFIMPAVFIVTMAPVAMTWMKMH